MAPDEEEHQRKPPPPVMDATQLLPAGSSILSRVSSFLPAIRAANEALVAVASNEEGARPDAPAVVLDTNLQAVLDEVDETSSSSSSEEESESDGSDSARSGDADSDGGEENSAEEEKEHHQQKTTKPATIVMDLQLGSLQDNPAMALIAQHDNSGDHDGGAGVEKEEEDVKVSGATARETAIRNLLDAKPPPRKKPKGPLITEC